MRMDATSRCHAVRLATRRKSRSERLKFSGLRGGWRRSGGGELAGQRAEPLGHGLLHEQADQKARRSPSSAPKGERESLFRQQPFGREPQHVQPRPR